MCKSQTCKDENPYVLDGFTEYITGYRQIRFQATTAESGFIMYARHGRSLTGESPECGLFTKKNTLSHLIPSRIISITLVVIFLYFMY